MAFTMKRAFDLSPETLRNDIVHNFDQRDQDTTAVNTSDVFPAYAMDAATEKFFRRHGGIAPMRSTGLLSESPISDIEDLTEDEIHVKTYKEKSSPEKGVDTELNNEREILRLYQETVNVLERKVSLTRDKICWQGDDVVDGMIGEDGNSPHPAFSTEHVLDPDGGGYDNHTESNPKQDFEYARYLVAENGMDLNQTGPITIYHSPSVHFDFTQNENLADLFKYSEPAMMDDEQVSRSFPAQLQEVNLKLPRQDAAGNLISYDGEVVNEPSEAGWDNVLEPYDPAAGRQRRNILIGSPGETSAFMPFYVERLAEHASNAEPTGQFAVDTAMGLLTQVWTEPDPAISWLKVAQEAGFHLLRPENWCIIQDV